MREIGPRIEDVSSSFSQCYPRFFRLLDLSDDSKFDLDDAAVAERTREVVIGMNVDLPPHVILFVAKTGTSLARPAALQKRLDGEHLRRSSSLAKVLFDSLLEAFLQARPSYLGRGRFA